MQRPSAQDTVPDYMLTGRPRTCGQKKEYGEVRFLNASWFTLPDGQPLQHLNEFLATGTPEPAEGSHQTAVNGVDERVYKCEEVCSTAPLLSCPH